MRYKQKSKSVDSNPKTPALTYITENTEIKADLQCDINIRIAGFIDGEVKSDHKIILNNTGKVKGAVISDEADIYGEVVGDVRVSNKLILRSTAVVDGEVSAKKIVIEDGAQLKGSLNVGPDHIQKLNNISSSDSAKLSA